MSELDRSLIYQTRKFITAANVHSVKTWMFCYEMSMPGTTTRRRYEKLLRDFVASNLQLVATRTQVERDRRGIR